MLLGGKLGVAKSIIREFLTPIFQSIIVMAKADTPNLDMIRVEAAKKRDRFYTDFTNMYEEVILDRHTDTVDSIDEMEALLACVLSQFMRYARIVADDTSIAMTAEIEANNGTAVRHLQNKRVELLAERPKKDTLSTTDFSDVAANEEVETTLSLVCAVPLAALVLSNDNPSNAMSTDSINNADASNADVSNPDAVQAVPSSAPNEASAEPQSTTSDSPEPESPTFEPHYREEIDENDKRVEYHAGWALHRGAPSTRVWYRQVIDEPTNTGEDNDQQDAPSAANLPEEAHNDARAKSPSRSVAPVL